jgi:hypothetical protein
VLVKITLRAEITLVRVEITIVRVEITLGRVFWKNERVLAKIYLKITPLCVGFYVSIRQRRENFPNNLKF